MQQRVLFLKNSTTDDVARRKSVCAAAPAAGRREEERRPCCRSAEARQRQRCRRGSGAWRRWGTTYCCPPSLRAFGAALLPPPPSVTPPTPCPSGTQALSIPRARVKRIMKADEDVKQIKPESVVVAAKAAVRRAPLFHAPPQKRAQTTLQKHVCYDKETCSSC